MWEGIVHFLGWMFCIIGLLAVTVGKLNQGIFISLLIGLSIIFVEASSFAKYEPNGISSEVELKKTYEQQQQDKQ